MDLEKMSLVELRALGKEKGVKSVTTLKKGELIERIKAAMGDVPEPVKSVESASKESKVSTKPPKKTGSKKIEVESIKVETEPPEAEMKSPKADMEAAKAKTESPKAEIKSLKSDMETAKAETKFSQIEIESNQIQAENNSETKSNSEPASVVTEQRLADTRAEEFQKPAESGYNNEKNTGNTSKTEIAKTEKFQRTDSNKNDNKYSKSAVRTDLSKSDNTRRDSQRNENGYRNETNRNEYNNRTDNNRNDNSGRTDSYNRTDNYRQQMNRNQVNRQDTNRTDAGRPDSSVVRVDNRNESRTNNIRNDNMRMEATKTTEQPPNDTYKNDYFKQPDEGNQPSGTTLDSGEIANGILEVLPDGYGFIRCANYLPGDNDIYVAPSMIRRFNLKTGDILTGNIRVKTQGEKFSALLYVSNVNGYHPAEAAKRIAFEELTPIFPNERIKLEKPGSSISMRIVDLLSPIGKGQRGMIVSPPKTGKTTLLKEIAKSISNSYPDIQLIVLLIDERPEEVTDIKESIAGSNVEVIYSTFDELPEHHKRVSEMVLERAKRLVEHKKDVVILLDSITRLARAYNLTVPPSGRTLTGGLDPAALHMPKKFFGAARNMREGGSLTVLATALVETGSKMDDVVFEEFKGTGNMELVLDRKLSEKRIFPAIDIPKSGTRRDDLLLTSQEQEVVYAMHKEMSTGRAEDTLDEILKLFIKTRNNTEFLQIVRKSLLR